MAPAAPPPTAEVVAAGNAVAIIRRALVAKSIVPADPPALRKVALQALEYSGPPVAWSDDVAKDAQSLRLAVIASRRIDVLPAVGRGMAQSVGDTGR